MSTPIIHKTFVIERTYPTTAARVFRAFSDPKKKQRWFVEGEGFTVESYSFDFRIGGFERSRFRHGDGPPMTFDAVYLDILDNERLVYAYSMTVGGQPLSGSLASMEMVQRGGETLLRVTEHTAFLDGNDGSADRREGTMALLEALARELAAHD
jgi:uncharacterized protein YndB with AHSA1/START domain